jgi:predicted Zn finger-like uncharacterized protein
VALATRCPNCQALFRVVADQLKLRGGLVRCGACRHVFDAIGSLAYVDDGTLSPLSPVNQRSGGIVPAPPAARPPARAPENRAGGAVRAEAKLQLETAGVPTLLATDATTAHEAAERTRAGDDQHAADADDADGSPRHRAGRTATAAEGRASAAAAADTDEDAEEDEEDAAEFLKDSGNTRGFSVVFGGGSAVLGLLLLLQAAVVFRTDLSTRMPESRPALVALCNLFGCSVSWPTRAELLAVVGSELQAIPGTDIFELTAVVRNRASFSVALPAIEVTLTDVQNRPLARKVFAPVDYLASAGEPSSRIEEGLAGGGDYVVRMTFEARGLNATGFVVYPFYL